MLPYVVGTKRVSSVLITEVIHCGIYRSGKVDVLSSLEGGGGGGGLWLLSLPILSYNCEI